ncbi:hypothetical protein BU24DRAFT_420667 [Aaosphaeria arxii CBS 175.79]|uniref:Solute carrier family 40 member n=1 Tax=Aaosphaeria arxii CBS 175.79 TaxID=1450172 RepID=A0A6A5XZC4_9PLEO|nr:uncharacterized protein BU24DRAFT_420667 [Aaosphaeria arxii CBS 175.79]KAF2017624.1 hypothetical protein BU24DRAFT_420667 [Aaosphaeria arxii CBS 175.79]
MPPPRRSISTQRRRSYSGSASTSSHASQSSSSPSTTSVLWRLYLSHALSTWNARTFEFGAVIFLATIFPHTLFYTSLYALCRSGAATVFSSYIGWIVDRTDRLVVVRQSIMWQRYTVAVSCLILQVLLWSNEDRLLTLTWFGIAIVLACFEKLAFVANTVAVERDWLIVIADSLGAEREDMNSSMRRIDLICKLVAPLCISLVDSYSTKIAIWVVFGQNALSAIIEYFAIAQVFAAVPELAQGRSRRARSDSHNGDLAADQQTDSTTPRNPIVANIVRALRPWKDYFWNPAFLASFSLSLLYLTVLSFASQMTTYLLTLGYTSFHVSTMRLAAVALELTATCAAPTLMRKIGAVRSGLWFVNEQLIAIALALVWFTALDFHTRLAGLALAAGVALSRVGLWGFDLSVQYLVQEDAPEATRGSFSAVEAALQNFFELVSFAITMIFHRPEQFQIPVFISAGAVALSATCFARFVRQKRGHFLHTSKCFRREGKLKYQVLPTIEEEGEDTPLDERSGS